MIAHLVEDKIIPESILTSLPKLAGDKIGKQMVDSISSSLRLPLEATVTKQKVREIVAEYFVSGDLKEAEERLSELKTARVGQEVVKRTLVEAMEKKNREREKASVLISSVTKLYGSEQFFEGFTKVLRSIDDLALDTPDVCQLLGNFIARAIVDDVLPPIFMTLVPEAVVSSERGAAVAGHVKVLMEQHSSTRIMNCWGNGAKASIEELKESIKTLVEEYFVEGELEEAVRCVQELDAPFFGHEVVKRVVYRGVEKGGESLRSSLNLLKTLLESGALDHHQLTMGMTRSVAGLPDLCLDVPDAPERLRTIADWLAFENLVSPSFEQAVLIKAKERKEGNSAPTVEKVKKYASFIVEEFLVSESSREAAISVAELKAASMHSELVKSILRLSMDKNDESRKQVVDLIASLCVRAAIEATDVEAGVELILKQLSDILLDVPKAKEYVAHFVAHFIDDRILPEEFLKSVPEMSGAEVGKSVVELVNGLMKLPLQVTITKQKIREIVQEYFVSDDLQETEARLTELKAGRLGHEVVKRVLVEALEKKNRERERASVLLSALTRDYGTEQFFEGFTKVLRSIDDLALDTPNVAEVLGNFIARAIVDDVLPPVFLDLVPERVGVSERGGHVVAHVKGLLEQHSSTRIMNVWGTGAKESVDELKDSVKTLVEEYFVEGELNEAVRCVQELEAPFFGHEVVKRIVYLGVERGGDGLGQSQKLVKALLDSGSLQKSQLTMGMGRVVMGLSDLSLDVPDAQTRFDSLTDMFIADGTLPSSFKAHTAAIRA